MNYSKQRELILKTLQANPVHPTADVLYALLKKQDLHLSLATVYRNLNQLAEAGMIRKITGLGVKDYFDHTLTPHHHFICERCGKVQDVPACIAPDVCQKAAQALSVQMTSYEMSFKGVCQDCQRHTGS